MGKSSTIHLEDISIINPRIEINVNLSKIGDGLNDAQLWLDTQIMNDMLPYIPLKTGSLRQRTQSRSISLAGTGEVCAAVSPYGRFQYFGKVMVDAKTGSPWARKGAVKVVTGRNLIYSQPTAKPRWFNVAKQKNISRWVTGVEERITK